MNDQFNELVKVTMSEKQALTENSDSIHTSRNDGWFSKNLQFLSR